jgi:antitoxin component HigA of HigAB toxin-antitoxin module
MSTATISKHRLRIINAKDDYREARVRLDEIIDAADDTAEFDELGVLGILISQYENKHFAVREPTLAEAIDFCCEQMGIQLVMRFARLEKADKHIISKTGSGRARAKKITGRAVKTNSKRSKA